LALKHDSVEAATGTAVQAGTKGVDPPRVAQQDDAAARRAPSITIPQARRIRVCVARHTAITGISMVDQYDLTI
jgi:hypothetical protein